MTPREISIKAILDHKLFTKDEYFCGNLCCAIGYALKANNYKIGILVDTEIKMTKFTGLNAKERFKITQLNDNGKFEKMKEYVRNLKK